MTREQCPACDRESCTCAATAWDRWFESGMDDFSLAESMAQDSLTTDFVSDMRAVLLDHRQCEGRLSQMTIERDEARELAEAMQHERNHVALERGIAIERIVEVKRERDEARAEVDYYKRIARAYQETAVIRTAIGKTP